ncbi:MAG: VCBS repeat-containing protein [Planctomycetes bacterium]|nr:VCBS repeat-containing protein [Planctomycetota bacterium]
MLTTLPLVLPVLASGFLPWQGSRATITDMASAVPGAYRVSAIEHAIEDRVDPEAQPPVLVSGWPKPITTSYNFATARGLCFEDLDGDGKKEIVCAYCNADNSTGTVYVWRHDGTVQKGWPQTTIGMAQYVPTVADLDGDGRFEIVQTTRGLTSGGRLYVFRDDGTAMPGWPKNLNNNIVSQAATCADLDGDGKLEIIALERAYPIGKVHVFRHDGSAFPGAWPVALDHVPATSAAVADVDADGKLEIVVASYNSLYCIQSDGTIETGWPYAMATKHAANFSYQSPAIADLRGDSKLEIVVCTHKTGSGCYMFDASGNLLGGWPQSFGGTWSYCAPTIADIDGDGKLDVLAGRDTQISNAAAIWAWDASGTVKTGFPVVKTGGGQAPLTVADIDGDGSVEFFVDSSAMNNNQGYLDCYDKAGKSVAGFPLRTPGFTYLNGATIGDVDGDGDLEIGVLVRDRNTTTNVGTDTIYLYELPGPTTTPQVLWKGYLGANERHGRAGDTDHFVTSGTATPGGELRIGFEGPATSVGIAFLGTAPTVVPIAPYGVLRLDLTGGISVLAAAVLTTGRAELRLPIPSNPTLKGIDLWLQGANVASGSLRLEELRAFRIR